MVRHELVIPTATTAVSAQLLLPELPFGLVILARGPFGDDPELDPLFAATFAEQGLASLTVRLEAGIHRGSHVSHADRRHALHMVSQRLIASTRWMRRLRATAALPIAYFGAGLAASAACTAAVACARDVQAIATWEGSFDLVGYDLLACLHAPLLMMLREDDGELLRDTRAAASHCASEHALKLVSEGDPRLDEPCAVAQAASYATSWFGPCLRVLGAASERTGAAAFS